MRAGLRDGVGHIVRDQGAKHIIESLWIHERGKNQLHKLAVQPYVQSRQQCGREIGKHGGEPLHRQRGFNTRETGSLRRHGNHIIQQIGHLGIRHRLHPVLRQGRKLDALDPQLREQVGDLGIHGVQECAEHLQVLVLREQRQRPQQRARRIGPDLRHHITDKVRDRLRRDEALGRHGDLRFQAQPVGCKGVDGPPDRIDRCEICQTNRFRRYEDEP